MENTNKYLINSTLFCICIILILEILISPFNNRAFASSASKKKKTVLINKKKTIKAQKKNTSKTEKKVIIRNKRSKTSNYTFLLVKDSLLNTGVHYKIYKSGKSNSSRTVHVVEADLKDSNVSVEILKAGRHCSELEKLHNMINHRDSLSSDKVIAAINGNFWKAYSNFPIGPAISDGEVIGFKTYKNWSSGFFDENGKLYIDNFRLNASFRDKRGKIYPFDAANRRLDSSGIILYTCFAGDTIPYITRKNLECDFVDYLQNIDNEDSTEVPCDTVRLRQELLNSERSAMIEYSLTKLSLQYIDSPGINKTVKCKLISIDTGAVAIPQYGCVISFGKNDFPQGVFKVSDTVILNFMTDKYCDITFINAICGTPRLVRNGVAGQEAYQEGSPGRRFINRGLPRTAIGTNKDKTKIFFAAVEPAASRRNTGLNLASMADIMKKIGCYDAMNLDGGGSTVMVINNKNVLLKNNPSHSRKISIGVSVVTKNNETNKAPNKANLSPTLPGK